MLFIFLLVCAILAFYFYVKKCNNYWARLGVRTIPSNSILGTSFDFLFGRRSYEEIYEDIYKKIKPNERYAGFYDLLQPILFIRDPELINQILVKDFSSFNHRFRRADLEGRLIFNVGMLDGEEWRVQRSKLSPIFSSSKLKKIYELIEESAEIMVNRHFRPYSKTGEVVNVKEIMSRFSLDVIGTCAFGLQFNTLEESDSLYHKLAVNMNDNRISNALRAVLLTINPKLMKWFGMTATAKKGEDFFFDLLHGAKKLRQKETEHRGDLLQLMLDIKDGQTDEARSLFTDAHIASNMFLFFFAGLDPPSITLTFALYELAMHPEMQDRLRQEIKEAREANGGHLDYETIKKIDYLEMILLETLRLHSPLNTALRVCNENYQIPRSSLKMKPGDKILYSLSAMHKDEKYYPNPLEFDPERFSKENLPQINPNTYRPFGGGPRICLGGNFAKLEMKICIVSIISRFKLTRHHKTPEPVVAEKRAQLHRPEGAIWLTIEEI